MRPDVSKDRQINEGCRELTALHSVTNHCTPHGLGLHGCTATGRGCLEHRSPSTTSRRPLLLETQATLRVCVPFPHSAEHWTQKDASSCCVRVEHFELAWRQRLPVPRGPCTTPHGPGRGPSHRGSLLLDAPPHSRPAEDQSRDLSGRSLPEFDGLGRTPQSTDGRRTHTHTNTHQKSLKPISSK